ncbi:hypothetical protein BCR37DRAFT_390253 [Protomyces lactucae-debilis]|uniref:Uncharacterized protein n=1 Tax=Protomyces lactucae-debilis TaxID=2754530 RepID=A0A1Y2FUN4_PROLT|nr:uncharacterized protein BCR37DRAFT_390253 [Protomyces lactucae-debilis]ORY87723.1 hypothetical protein BCR37DRAFT_390253 [Protomyces lactucae-debilis]
MATESVQWDEKSMDLDLEGGDEQVLPKYSRHELQALENPSWTVDQVKTLVLELLVALLVAMSVAHLIIAYMREHGIVFSVAWRSSTVCGSAASFLEVSWPTVAENASQAASALNKQQAPDFTGLGQLCKTVHRFMSFYAH